MTTTDQTWADTQRAVDLSAELRDIADAIGDCMMPAPRGKVRLYLSGLHLYGEQARAAFLSTRRAFPDAPVEAGDHYVQIAASANVLLLFDRSDLGTVTTTTREVTEYVLDPELLAPIVPPSAFDETANGVFS